MRVLITGGAGYIGSHATRHFLRAGHEVTVYDNLSTGRRRLVQAGHFVEGDLADLALLEQTLRSARIEAVVHFAGCALVGESIANPELYYRNNLYNSLGLMSAMHRQGISRFVFSSTCATYGSPARMPITEDTEQRPINPYGRSKLAVEQALRDYAASYGWGVAILRYFNAAGANSDGTLGEDHENETRLIPLAIFAALGRRSHLDIYGADYPTPDGTCVRDYVHVDDLGDAHVKALERLAPGRPVVCNLGMGRGYSVREVVRAVEEVGRRKVPVVERPRREGDPPVLVAAVERAKSELNWEARYGDIESVVRTAFAWHSR